MIQFNELKISDDSKDLIINTQVKNLSYYTDVYLDTIKIDTQDTFIESGPSSKAVYTYTAPDNTKSVSLDLTSSDILPSLDTNMFFVWVTVKGTPSADTPCRMDTVSTLGVVVSLYPIYRGLLNYMGEVERDCEVPKNFINLILRYEAFRLALRTGNYTEAIKFWNRYFGKRMNILNYSTVYGCNCHG